MKKSIKKFIKNNIGGFIIGSILFGTVGVCAATVIIGEQVSYDNSNSGLDATNVQSALDEIYEITNQICPEGAYCPPLLTPKYFEIGEPTTSSTQNWRSLNKNIFVGMGENGKKGVCINKDNKLHCFSNNNYDTESLHIKQVFGESSCTVDSSHVHCYDGAFSCYVYAFGDVHCNGAGQYCDVFYDDSVDCN